MPSSHSTIVACLATCVGMSEGFDTALFVVCCALALIVMYDASGIKELLVSRQKMINMIVETWEEKRPGIEG